MEINSSFLIKYLAAFYTKETMYQSKNTFIQLQFVWNFNDYSNLIEKAINLIIENSLPSGLFEHPISMFFTNLDGEQKNKAKNFLTSYINKYYLDTVKMNSIFDTLRTTLKEFFEEFTIQYLKLFPSLDNFKKISWLGSSRSYNGEVIIGEVNAKDWALILNIVNKVENSLELIPIKAYIKDQIHFELKYAEQERRIRFINPDGF